MPRTALSKPEQLPADSKPTLDRFTKNIGFTPNILATFAQSPVAFNAWATLRDSLSNVLDEKTRESISLAVSEVNGCNYCLAVHSLWAEHSAKLPANDIILARKGHASDAKRDAAVQFAHQVIETRGQVSDADLEAVRDAGYTDAKVMEIIALVAMYSLTNFSITCSIPRRTFPPLRWLVRSKHYPNTIRSHRRLVTEGSP